MSAASQESIQFHMVSYCSAIKILLLKLLYCPCTIVLRVVSFLPTSLRTNPPLSYLGVGDVKAGGV